MNFDMTEETQRNKVNEAPKITDLTLTKSRDFNVIKQALLDMYYGDIEKLHNHALTHKVIDRESEIESLESEALARQLHRALEEKRKEIIQEPDGFVRNVNKMVKTFRDRVEAAISAYNKTRTNYAWAKEKERLELEKKQKEEIKKLQDQVMKEAEEKGLEMPPPPPLPVEKKELKIRTDTGATSILKTEWTYEVEHFEQVSDEYKLIDDKAIKAAIKAGIREIIGLRIFEVPKSKVRI